ncbi:hypothetical protein M9458_031469, partial [Cirrhinus mrigala]
MREVQRWLVMESSLSNGWNGASVESNAEEREALEPLRVEFELLRQHTGTDRPSPTTDPFLNPVQVQTVSLMSAIPSENISFAPLCALV